MIGAIERVKNNVLLKSSTLNDEIISKTLNNLVDTCIYRFAEEILSLMSDVNTNLDEQKIREDASLEIKNLIFKKIKRKLFIDSLALQITNDTFIEDYANDKISLDEISNNYIVELNKNKNSNQLNMTEDLNLTEIMLKLRVYVDKNISPKAGENMFLKNALSNLVDDMKNDLEKKLKQMIDDANLKYLDILISELKTEIKKEEEKEIIKGDEEMFENVNTNYEVENIITNEQENNSSKFDKYDDMTLFNKMILSLNTKEEKLSRKESKLEKRKQEVEKRLKDTNKNIESNIERENKLSKRQLDLNNKELEINSKLSEAEVIFLNMKPLLKGLNKIKVSDLNGGSKNE